MKTKTLKELVFFLKDEDSPLGDLCNDMLDDKIFEKENTATKVFKRLKNIASCHPYIEEPLIRLKNIYSLIHYKKLKQ